ncbi:MAG: hypothetical protein AAF226_17430, partial [Verrucomicrobiota bacterium]
SSKLVVRQTAQQMELIETLIEEMIEVAPIIHYEVSEALIPKSLIEDETFDWPVGVSLPNLKKSPRAKVLDREQMIQILRRPPVPLKERTHVTVSVLTNPQFQLLINDLSQRKTVDFQNLGSATALPGDCILLEHKIARHGIKGVVGLDSYTIDLDCYFPPRGSVIEGPLPTARVTIWDGQIVAVSENDPKNKNLRVVFLSARLIDPEGNPVHPSATAAETDKGSDSFSIRRFIEK